MERPAGVTFAAWVFFLVGSSIGFLALFMLMASFGMVQNPRGSTGIFANGALGEIGLFLGTIVLAVAAAVFYVGVGLWRLQKWARLTAVVLWGVVAAYFVRTLFSSLPNPSLDALLTGPVFTALAALMVKYLFRPDVIAAFDNAGPPPLQPGFFSLKPLRSRPWARSKRS